MFFFFLGFVDVENININCPRHVPHVSFRLKHTEEHMNLLSFDSMLDIGGNQFKNYCIKRNITDTHVDLYKPLKTGQGGYFGGGDTYDGRNLPYRKNSFDLVLISFVLHHASHNTFAILRQVYHITNKYLIVGEDLSQLDYPMKWHVRNNKHQPGGLFRSDEEWREIFFFLKFKLVKTITITEDIDIDKKHKYRILYFLEKM